MVPMNLERVTVALARGMVDGWVGIDDDGDDRCDSSDDVVIVDAYRKER